MKHLALLPLTFAGLSDFWAVRISPVFRLVMVNHPCSSLCSTIHFCTSLLFVAKDSKSTTEPDFGVKLSIPNTLDEFLVSITPSAPGRGNVHWVLLNCQMPPLFLSLESVVNFHNWSENMLSNSHRISILYVMLSCEHFLWIAKGQLISKCPFGVKTSSKIYQWHFFQDFCPSL